MKLLVITTIFIIISSMTLVQAENQSSGEKNFFPETFTDWATITGELAVGAGFIFLILEYRNARIQRREDNKARKEEEKLRHDEEFQKCKAQYYEALNKLIDDPALGKFYDEMDTKGWGYWNELKRDPEKEKIYSFAEYIYYLCRRVHYLRSIRWIDSNQWNEWDGWIEDLVTSKTFRGVHVDSNEKFPTDFGKHVDSHLKKLKDEKQLDFGESVNNYIKKIPSHCECKVCKKIKQNGEPKLPETN